MQTKQVTLYTALLLGTLVAPLLHAQILAGAPAPPVRLANAEPRPPMLGGGPKAQALTSLTTLSGTVGQLTDNEDGILNGFTINTSATPQTVRFGTHLGQQVNAAVKAGSRITVTGYSEVSPMGESTFKLVKLDAGKAQVIDTPPALLTNPATPTRQRISGRVIDFQLNRDGQVNGLIMNDQTVVKVLPHGTRQLATLAPKGSTVTVEGYAQPLGEGQVQLQKQTTLRGSVLTVGGQSYLIQ